MTKTVNIKLRITEAMHQRLQELAQEAERSVAAEVRLAIREHLERQHTDEDNDQPLAANGVRA